MASVVFQMPVPALLFQTGDVVEKENVWAPVPLVAVTAKRWPAAALLSVTWPIASIEHPAKAGLSDQVTGGVVIGWKFWSCTLAVTVTTVLPLKGSATENGPDTLTKPGVDV